MSDIPKRANAWLVRDRDYKMRRAIFFHPDHAKEYRRESGDLFYLKTEIVKVKILIEEYDANLDKTNE